MKTESTAVDPLSLPQNSQAGLTTSSPYSPHSSTLHMRHSDEKTPPKKRGRKAKIHSGEKLSSQQQNDSSDHTPPYSSASSAFHSKKLTRDELVIPKRSQRRIKPTTKILENDELRYEFETKHMERITAQQWENAVGQTPTGEVTHETPTHQVVLSSVALSEKTPSTNAKQRESREKSEHSGESHPSGSSAVKKKLFSKSQRDSEAALLAQSSARRSCPDLATFLSEIKAAKLNLNKSPEDKKLSKKQQRKLAKQKEKHLEKLGLRRNTSEEASENNSSSDNEEFVPTTRVQVGKPSVTLRLRPAKESTPTPTPTATPTSTTTITATTKLPQLTRKPRQKLQKDRPPNATNHVMEIEPDELQALNAAVLSAAKPTPQRQRRATEEKNLICLCQKPTQYYTRNTPETSFCCAIDNIEEQKVGCCNQLSGDVLNLLRPSQRVGYMILCDDHKKRLRAHNCCAGCGNFCTQVRFILKGVIGLLSQH